MRSEIKKLHKKMKTTFIYVTHDQAEAMAISDQIIIMNKGVIAQMGTPEEIYHHPNSEFVADFIGEVNFLMGEVVKAEQNACTVRIAGHDVYVGNAPGFAVGQACKVVLRPEAGILSDTGALPCKVVLSCFMGAYQNYHVMVGDTLVKLADYCPVGRKVYQVGDTAYLSFREGCVSML